MAGKELDLDLDSPVLKRLIEEVENDIKTGEINNYNRMHNRHNRSGGWRRSYTPTIFEPKPEAKNTDSIGGKSKNCSVCQLPIEPDATPHEKRYFELFGQHKQCVHKDYVRGSE